MFSKSFGYALRGILYVSFVGGEDRKVSIEEIAERLGVPRYFLGKVMKSMVKAGILNSSRGKSGGFFTNENTLKTTIIKIIMLVEGQEYFNSCLLSLHKCNSSRPCPMHDKIQLFKNNLIGMYSQTTIGDLLKENMPDFIRSIAIANDAIR